MNGNERNGRRSKWLVSFFTTISTFPILLCFPFPSDFFIRTILEDLSLREKQMMQFEGFKRFQTIERADREGERVR